VPNLTDEALNVIKDSHSALLSLLTRGNAALSEMEQLTNPSNVALLAVFFATASPVVVTSVARLTTCAHDELPG
jgi:hypothetical protein